MRSMCVNVHVPLMRRTLHMAVVLHRQRLVEVRSFVKTRRESVYHHRRQCRKHGDEAREGEIPPRISSEAGACQALESFGQDVYETGRENHSGREGFDHEEDVVFGAQRWDFLAQNGKRHADCAGYKY